MSESNHDAQGAKPSEDAYAELKRNGPPADQAGVDRLWQLIFGLENWFFVTSIAKAEEAMESGGAPMPFIGMVDDKPMVFAFTSDDRATAWGIGAAEAEGSDDGFGVMGMPRVGALDFLVSLPDEIFGVVFNESPDHQAVFAPVDLLPSMIERYEGRRTPAGLDRAVRAASSGRQPEAMRAVAGMITREPEWVVLMSAEQQPVVAPIGDEACFVLFTDPDRATKGLEAMGAATPSEASPAAAPPAQVAMTMQQVQLASGGQVTKVVINIGTQPLIASIDEVGNWVQQLAPKGGA